MQVVLEREGKEEEWSEGNELREGRIPRKQVLTAAEAMEGEEWLHLRYFQKH